MKFLVDANLPEILSNWISQKGFESKHTLSFPKENDTEDEEILEYLELNPCILVSKDSDFFKSFLIHGKPKKLLFVTTGNISNSELILLFQNNFLKIVIAFENFNVIELSRENIITHF